MSSMAFSGLVMSEEGIYKLEDKSIDSAKKWKGKIRSLGSWGKKQRNTEELCGIYRGCNV